MTANGGLAVRGAGTVRGEVQAQRFAGGRFGIVAVGIVDIGVADVIVTITLIVIARSGATWRSRLMHKSWIATLRSR
jgi:hypothetical protein